MAGKFSIPRFEHEDLDITQELPELPEEFEPIAEDPIPDYEYQAPAKPQPPRPQPRPVREEPEAEYDPDEDLPEDFIDIALRILGDIPGFFKKHGKKIAIGVSVLIFVVLAGVIGSFAFQARDPYDKKILNNVMIADILVGGMTKDQAQAAVSGQLASDFTNKAMTIHMGDTALELDPAQVGAKLNVQAVVEAAYEYGRTGSQAERDIAYQNSLSSNYVIAVLPYLELNEKYIQKALKTFQEETVSVLTQPTFVMEGEADDLSTETFNPAASAEVLVITLGTPQVDFDADALYSQILDAYSLGNFELEVPGPVVTQEPDPVDMDAIYQAFFLEPVAPTLNMTDFSAIPGAYGRDFDLDAAKNLLAQANPGEEIRISMTYPAPEGDPTSVLYRDVLGEARTTLSGNASWDQNVKTAVKAIHGIDLKPGDTFSMSAVLGQPSEGRGYLPAVCGSGEPAAGEGICQVASTMYVAALLSDLEITARTPHTGAVSYTEFGKDADFAWGSMDFAFRNSSLYPIRIEAEISGSSLHVKFIGTDNRSYRTDLEVAVSETIQPKIIYQEFSADNAEGYADGDVIQAGATGSQVKTYKRKYDKGDGSLVSRDFIATSSYPSQDKIIARVAPPVAEPTLPPSEVVPGAEPGSEAVG